MSIKIFTDSTADLSRKQLEQNDISVVPLYVTFGEETYRDGIDLTTDSFYDKVEEYGNIPVTGAPSPEDYYRAFKPVVEKGEKIICISISSKLSASYQNAVIAANRFGGDRVEIIDSRNASTGTGLLVLKAADYLKEGREFAEIVKDLRNKASRGYTEFIIDTLDYLHKGGRCSGIQKFLGNILKIRPVVKIKDGKLVPVEKTRGSRRRAIERLLARALENVGEADRERVFITHSRGGEAVSFLEEALREKTDFKNILVAEVGCVISTHCGPGTTGILFLRK